MAILRYFELKRGNDDLSSGWMGLNWCNYVISRHISSISSNINPQPSNWRRPFVGQGFVVNFAVCCFGFDGAITSDAFCRSRVVHEEANSDLTATQRHSFLAIEAKMLLELLGCFFTLIGLTLHVVAVGAASQLWWAPASLGIVLTLHAVVVVVAAAAVVVVVAVVIAVAVAVDAASQLWLPPPSLEIVLTLHAVVGVLWL